MKSFFRRKLVIGATGLVLLGGAGAAVAATQSGGTSRQAYFNDVAHRLGVSPTALTSAMKGAAIDRIDAELAAGRITQAQANRLKQRVESGHGLPFFGHRFGGAGLRAGANAAARYLGISDATLRSDLASGKTLAQIASSTPGKSVTGLKSAILNLEKTRLDKAVSAGRITSHEENTRLARLSSRLDTLLNAKWSGPTGHWRGLAGPRL
jgi:hypothetical protein